MPHNKNKNSVSVPLILPPVLISSTKISPMCIESHVEKTSHPTQRKNTFFLTYEKRLPDIDNSAPRSDPNKTSQNSIHLLGGIFLLLLKCFWKRDIFSCSPLWERLAFHRSLCSSGSFPPKILHFADKKSIKMKMIKMHTNLNRNPSKWKDRNSYKCWLLYFTMLLCLFVLVITFHKCKSLH